jgi:hypothetical protein
MVDVDDPARHETIGKHQRSIDDSNAGHCPLSQMSDYELMLRRGDQVPHFEVTTVGGELFRYASIWQHKSLALVALPADAPAGAYDSCEQATRRDTFPQRERVCVVTRNRIPGLQAPAALVADRWGEIVYVIEASHMDGLPAPSDLLDWLDYVEQRCPECEGESR